MRTLASPAFPDDDGTADPALQRTIAEYARSGQLGGVLESLGVARVIVPVVAMPAQAPAADARRSGGGSGGEKEGDMAAILMTGADGRTALLAFSCLASLQAWDPQARPVPVSTVDAARAARHEGASALVLDLAGPVRVVVESADLAHLADGELLARTDVGYVWRNRRS